MREGGMERGTKFPWKRESKGNDESNNRTFGGSFMRLGGVKGSESKGIISPPYPPFTPRKRSVFSPLFIPPSLKLP